MNKKDYDKNGNRITPFRTMHKGIRHRSSQYKDLNGYYHLKVENGIVSDKTIMKNLNSITIYNKIGDSK